MRIIGFIGRRHTGRFFAWTAGGDAIGKFAVLATSVLAARQLTPAGFGRYACLVAAGLVAASCWDAGMSTLVARQTSAGELQLRQAVREAGWLRLRLVPVWAVVFGGALAISGGAPAPAICLFGAASLVFSIHTAILGVLRGALQFESAATVLAIGRVVTASLAGALLVGVAHGDNNLLLLGAATLVGELATLLLAVRRLRTLRLDSPPHGHAGLRLRRSAPFAANGLLYMTYNRLDVIIVPALATQAQLQRYAPASRLQDALYLLPFALQSVAVPVATRMWRNGGADDLHRFVTRMVAAGLAVAVPLAAVTCVFAPTLLATTLGGSYRDSETPLRILVWFLPLAVVQAPLLAAFIAIGRPMETTKVIAVTFVVAIGMHLALDPAWGATGGAIASLCRDAVAAPFAILLAVRLRIIRLGASPEPLAGVA